MPPAFLLFLLALGGAERSAQSRLRDPFAGVSAQSDQRSPDSLRATALERRAFAAATEIGAPAARDLWITTERVAGRDLVLIRGWTGGGTGAGQLSYLIFAPGGRNRVRRVWSAVAEEYSSPPRRIGTLRIDARPYHLRGCLYRTADGLFGYAVTMIPSTKDRPFDAPAFPRAGYYAWSGRRDTLVWLRAPDRALTQRCARERNLL